MATKLDKALRREVDIKGVAYMITMAPEGLKIVEKGRRKGMELSWEQIMRGDAAGPADPRESVELTME